ncbi:odorant receptor 4-like isoform X2 [Bombus affinis]|uniref:odorant receptor 4-like isoform X2 n=1 Tax=Bombus affinis TaxID=309941 RepID=UPI0021B828B4|nr:odorant receptor 4-like isoform X2 [Bombus affinis]
MTNQSVTIGVNAKTNSDYGLQLNRWFLKPIGVWPSSPSTTRFEKIISITLNVICYTSIILTTIPCLVRMFLEDESIYLKVKSLGPVSHWIVSGANYTTLLLRSNDIRQCMEHMEADWQTVTREKDQWVMLKNAKFGRYVAASCAIFMQGGIMCFIFVTAMDTVEIQIGNETRILHVLPCAVYKKLINVDESPTNEIVLFLQAWSTIIANSSTVGIFSLAAVLAAHACGQLNVVMVWITEFVNEPKKANGPKGIGVIVERHLRTLNFIGYIENLMNRIYFLEIFRCTMDICILGYYILSEWDDQNVQSLVTYVMIYISIGFNVFLICYIGEILTEQSKKVGEVVYMTNWYYLPDKTILDLILIIARSSVVVQITAGKMVLMSVYTFGDVVKTGFAYLNLLRQIT